MSSRRTYGLSSEWFVTPKNNTYSMVIGGVSEDSGRWTRVLSQRAAHLLWFRLAQHLYPERADGVTAVVHTMPARAAEMPVITHHIAVDSIDAHQFEVIGWVSDQTWTARLTHHEAQRLWDAVNSALYPTTV